jgi:hypothetical protein
MNKRVWLWLLATLLAVFALSARSGYSNHTTASTVIISTLVATPSVTVQNTFPRNLVCSDVEVTGMAGSTWNGITTGESTVEDLLERFEAEDQEAVEWPSGALSYRLLDGPNLYTVNVCTQDSIIIVLSISMSNAEPVFLDEFVVGYGIPDVVTYSFGAYSRVVFWFERGVAIEAYAGIDSPFFGRVGQIVFFPPQLTKGYAERWPYNRTWPVWIPPHEKRDDLSSVQNPFDFDAMIATVTAHPSRTPTPTFTPRPIQTATPIPRPTSTPD